MDKIPAVKMAKLKIKIYLILFLLFFFFIIGVVVLFVVNSVDNSDGLHHFREEENEEDTDFYIGNGIAPEVLRYKPYFEKYAKKYFISQHVDVLMAVTMQESGGRLLDVMQSSESIGLPPNSITDPELSIDVGTKYFSQVMKDAEGEVKLSLQSYNFGSGFINYALERGGYSKRVAFDFSQMMAEKMGWSRYGDVNYVDNVMRYLEEDDSVPINVRGAWALPLKEIRITSRFGPRTHPITGELESFHGGADFGCTPRDNIMAVKDGEVVEAIHGNTGYGNYVTLQHGNKEFSRYAHMSLLNVSPGDSVSQGQAVGKCGTTGSSTGNHLHLEHLTELGQAHQDKVDPLKTLGLE
ncbi:lysozyme family protein [Oceanobacillus alkalisoli]|uniref:lysozyme family protein n=1 Tax=Oceanobacillus alkalisoli TaxID=2925113 RepID=UPI001EE3BB1E|nr:lysozyme family protein [Oceanobacillus alkalisoli]MCG5105364.1 lysozyme family protein [Oceanobacillus alkalisoli]